MKKVLLILFLLAQILLCSCSKKADSNYPEFPKTKWGMSMNETLDAYKISKKDTSYYEEGLGFTLKGYKLFGEKTSEIIFSFIDLKDGNPVLCAVNVTYPDNTDMINVLKKMQKKYGKTISAVTIYDLYQAIETKIPVRDYTESEHLKFWADEPVIKYLPEKENEIYRDHWKPYQPGLNAETWDTFTQNARMVTVVWSDNGEFPSLEKNSLTFKAYNLIVYNFLKNRLSNQK